MAKEEKKTDAAPKMPVIHGHIAPDDGPTGPAGPPGKQTVEYWAARKKHLPQPFHQARMLRRWVIGQEVTEKEYDAAVAAIDDLRFG